MQNSNNKLQTEKDSINKVEKNLQTDINQKTQEIYSLTEQVCMLKNLNKKSYIVLLLMLKIRKMTKKQKIKNYKILWQH